MSTYLISLDTLKTIGKGVLGAMTFGVFTQYNNDKHMELNNKYFNDKIKKLEDDNKELKDLISKKWFF